MILNQKPDVDVAALLFGALTCQLRRAPTDSERPQSDGKVGVRPGELVRALIVVPFDGDAAQYMTAIRSLSEQLNSVGASLVGGGDRSISVRRTDGTTISIETVVCRGGISNLRSTWVASALIDRGLADGAARDAVAAIRTRLLPGAVMAHRAPGASGCGLN